MKIWYLHMWRYRWFRWYHVCLLNCTWIRWCIIEISSGLPRKSSAIFGNFRKFSEKVWERSSGLRNNFGESSEIFGKWLEIFGKSWKKCGHQYVYIIKRTLHVSLKIWFYVLVARTISHSLAALTRETLLLPLEHKIHIFSLVKIFQRSSRILKDLHEDLYEDLN